MDAEREREGGTGLTEGGMRPPLPLRDSAGMRRDHLFGRWRDLFEVAEVVRINPEDQGRALSERGGVAL